MQSILPTCQLLTIRQLCSMYSWPSESALRAYIYRAEELGIEDAFVRVKRRVLINPEKFFLLIRQLEGCSKKGGTYGTNKPHKGTAGVEVSNT